MTFGSNGSDPANWPEQACAENIQCTRERTPTYCGRTNRNSDGRKQVTPVSEALRPWGWFRDFEKMVL